MVNSFAVSQLDNVSYLYPITIYPITNIIKSIFQMESVVVLAREVQSVISDCVKELIILLMSA